MSKRVDENRFEDDHYLGLPAAADDKIIQRRVNLVEAIDGFCNNNLSLVDVGCGNGATVSLLADKFGSCTGVDIYPENGKAFEALMKERSVSNATFKLANIEEEPLADQFDRLICFEVIEHFKDDSNASRLFDMLKPGGMAAITVPNKWWVFETHGAKLPLLPWNRVPFFSWLPTPLHERWANARIYSKGRIIKLLQGAGFDIKDTKYVTAPMDVLPKGMLKDALTGTIFKPDSTWNPMWATSIFLSLEKPA